MLSKLVTVGDKIEIKRISQLARSSSDEDGSKTYVSEIYDILSDEKLTVAMPISGRRFIPFEAGTICDVNFVTKRGLYRADVQITNSYKQDKLYVLDMDLISNLVKHQRRQYYRLNYRMEIKYKVLTDEEVENFKDNGDEVTVDGDLKSAMALDISGGGMKFITSDQLNKKDKLIIQFDLDLPEKIYQLNVLARVISEEFFKEDINKIRVEFYNMKNKTRELLIKYIFEQDRIRRKRVKD